MSALRTEDLTVGYRTSKHASTPVLRGLNLSVKPGELVCLLGPNGTGKSTLLRTLSRLQPALSGSIEVGGENLERLSRIELARRIGVVLTDRPMVGALPASRLVELGRYPHVGWFGSLSDADRQIVERAIRAVGAEQLAARDSNTLSDGERQRFMIARALAQEPSILLLDEPTAFLDVPSRVQVMGLLRRLAREQNIAVIVSTHDLELALRMADTLWLVGTSGEFHAATPEDAILDGTLAETFRAENIRFHPEERAFRVASHARGRVVIQGGGLEAVLAAAVFEREGYEVVPESPAAVRVAIGPGSTRWEVVADGCTHEGGTFSDLAALVRGGIQRRS